MIRFRRQWGQNRRLSSVDPASEAFAWIVAVLVCAAAFWISAAR